MKLDETQRKRDTGNQAAEFDNAFKRFVRAIVRSAKAEANTQGSSGEDLEHAIATQALDNRLGLSSRLLDAVREQVAKTPEVQRSWDSLLSDIQREQSRMW